MTNKPHTSERFPPRVWIAEGKHSGVIQKILFTNGKEQPPFEKTEYLSLEEHEAILIKDRLDILEKLNEAKTALGVISQERISKSDNVVYVKSTAARIATDVLAKLQAGEAPSTGERGENKNGSH